MTRPVPIMIMIRIPIHQNTAFWAKLKRPTSGIRSSLPARKVWMFFSQLSSAGDHRFTRQKRKNRPM